MASTIIHVLPGDLSVGSNTTIRTISHTDGTNIVEKSYYKVGVNQGTSGGTEIAAIITSVSPGEYLIHVRAVALVLTTATREVLKTTRTIQNAAGVITATSLIDEVSNASWTFTTGANVYNLLLLDTASVKNYNIVITIQPVNTTIANTGNITVAFPDLS
jgi:hypothetical protein